jgi:hypothetical protein
MGEAEYRVPVLDGARSRLRKRKTANHERVDAGTEVTSLYKKSGVFILIARLYGLDVLSTAREVV